LLYHRIARSQTSDPYYVPPEEFQAQMQALKNWGYTSIPISLLVDAINYGVKMPPRPIVITFDDGDVTVYSQAFPIMREYGFIGVNYLVTNYVGTDGYMGVEQLKELAAAGWQTGSHSISHVDLTSIKILAWEVVESHHKLEKLLGVPVKTFAYPFGKMNEDARILVQQKYSAGVGLGVYVTQRRANLDYLWRRPVKPGWDVETFGAFLPWNTPPEP
jgi:peptidoglycan/xylan/chitin deacetylase (PgdA/CDA1 family)